MTNGGEGRRNRGQFRKGVSGNPKGRPRSDRVKPAAAEGPASLADAVWDAFQEKVQVNSGGVPTSMTAFEAFARSLAAGALQAKGAEKLKYGDVIAKLLKSRPQAARRGVIEPFSWGREQELLYRELFDDGSDEPSGNT